MKLQIIIVFIFSFLFWGCTSKPLDPVSFDRVNKDISFTKDVKPILDNRCVSCHSCYNSPCQLNLGSFAGLDRGASKDLVYATRMKAANPTRLFVDALNTKEWRDKSFFYMTDKM